MSRENLSLQLSQLRRFMRKKVDPFVRANSASASSDCLALTELTLLGEQKCLYGVKFARLGGRAHQHRKVTRLGTVPY